MFDNLREDLRRYGEDPAHQLRAALVNPGAWAVIAYRFRRWVQSSPLPAPVKLPMKVPATLANVLVKATTGIELPVAADIGPGLLIAHSGYVVLSSGVTLGRHCTLTHGVTIGHAAGGSRSTRESPSIGDRVYIGPGSAIVGPVEVGNDALIGIGAVVTRSIPDRAVVAGNPCRVLSTKGSFQMIKYPTMQSDPERQAALEAAGEVAEDD